MKTIIAATVLGAVVLTASAEDKTISAKLDYTYASRYVTHGFNVGDTPAHQPSISIETSKIPGFTFKFWSSLTVDRDKKQNDELDFMFIYNRSLMKDKLWAVDLSAYYDYWLYPNNPQPDGSDLQGNKFHLGGTLPNVIPMPENYNLVPGYNFYYWMPLTENQFDSGGIHELMLKSDIPLPLPEKPAVPQSVSIKGTINYNTGFLGFEGWTHATAHIGTGAPIWEMISWNASLDYQWTFDDTLNGNGDNIFWGTIGLSAEF